MAGLQWFFENLWMGVYNLFYAIAHPGLWLDWSNNESMMRFIYYGGSTEFFFVLFVLFLVFTAAGLWRRALLWGAVRVLEAFANTTGRLAAWAGLLMVLQQIIIIFIQRIFASSQISVGFVLLPRRTMYIREPTSSAAATCLESLR